MALKGTGVELDIASSLEDAKDFLSNNKCEIIISDITIEKSVNNLYKKIPNKNQIELLINNAGIAIFKDISNTSVDDWDETINVNLRGAFLMTKSLIDNFKKKKNGKVVFINSGAGLKPFANSSAYVASKYALRGFASSIREELREFNIKVISVFPGAVNTPLWNNKNVEEIRKDMMSVDDLCQSIIHSINAPNNCVVEEILIKRTLHKQILYIHRLGQKKFAVIGTSMSCV